MAKSSFKLDKRFGEHLENPKPKDSLRPLGDAVRATANNIRDNTISSIESARRRKASEVQAIKNGYDANGPRQGHGYLRVKAEEFALKSTGDNTHAVMDTPGRARVIMDRTGSVSLEYGGLDTGVVLGRGSSEHPNHPAYAFLRRALDRA